MVFARRTFFMMKDFWWLLAVPAVFTSFTLHAETRLPAFPGAEGFGRFATGGRGGTVYHVTNLNDSGPGSFRDAVSQPKRTVVFDVAGVIAISRPVVVSQNITIAGQTAPGDGVVIYGNGISFSGANNSIARHIRFRMGVNGDHGKDAAGIAHGHDLIFDHVSVSWGRDENFSINGVATNITIQNSIIAQGLQHHSAGGLIQTSGGVSILRTLYCDNYTRNPKVKGVNQYVNNVVYNWGDGGCYILGDSAAPSFANVANNYFIAGPDTGSEAFIRGNMNFHLFADNNFEDRNRNGILDGAVIPEKAYGVVNWRTKPFDFPAVAPMSPVQAYKIVIAQAGASLRRDAVDQRLIEEVLSLGRTGQIITNENDPPMFGPGKIAAGKALPDADQDEMPDDWETARGLNPQDSEDRNQLAASGYTQLEEYMNWRAEPHVRTAGGAPLDLDLRKFVGGLKVSGFEISEVRHCAARLLADGVTARISFESGFAGCAGFRFSTRDSDPISRRIGVLVSKPSTVANASAFPDSPRDRMHN
jgi:hypothetical protein